METTTIQSKASELLEREKAITRVKETFEEALKQQLNLIKVSSPLVVVDGTGINDDLNGVERAVKFPIKSLDEKKGVVVHSLAKWKRVRLGELGIEEEKGLVTDMRALRPDEDVTPIHSIYVDQWDWEKHITPEKRTIGYLKETVLKIYQALKHTELVVSKEIEGCSPVLPDEITFVFAEELLQKYPELTPKERENKAAKEYGAVFIIGIGGKLSNGEPHDGRAPDYDDWSTENEAGYRGLNGDIIVWNPTLEAGFELSSMGIRVDKEALVRQLEIAGAEDRKSLYFHSLLLSDAIPQSVGGGIGQSRVVMFLLHKKHIGEVQVGIWPEAVKAELAEKGVELL